MARPKCPRMVNCRPGYSYYKPSGIPVSALEEIALTLDELEAVRLADYEGLYQEQAAEAMKVSRQTFGRIITGAHKKIADALLNGKAMRIEEGLIDMPEKRTFQCRSCENAWELPYGTGRPDGCPVCGSGEIYRDGEGEGHHRHRRGRRDDLAELEDKQKDPGR